MPPIALTDSQLAAITRLAAPLAPVDRSAFLQAVASKLAEHPELLGDGYLTRVALETQKKFWRPPDLDVSGKYGR